MNTTVFAVFVAVTLVFVSGVPSYGTHQIGDAEAREFEELINSTFNSWIEPLKQWDPVHEEFVEFDKVVISGKLQNAYVGGFSHQYLSHIKLKISIIKPSFEVTYEYPYFKASIDNYLLEGLVTGDGEVSFIGKDLKFELVTNVDLLNPMESEFKLELSFDAKFNLTGLFHDEDLSQHITDSINKFLSYFK